jgi:hypothetical protein
VKLLERQPEIAPAPRPEPPLAETRPEEPVDPGAPTCRSCGATMAPDQDWCLACGTATGRLGARPGSRSAMTVLGLTGLLVAGAVAASYAALREDRTVPGRPAAATQQVAQAPPATTAPPPSTATTTPPASTTTSPSSGSTTGSSKLPKVEVPTNASPAPAPTPSPAPRTTTTAPSATPPRTPRTTRTPTPTQSAPTPTPTPTPPSNGGGGSQTTTPGSGQSTTPAPAAPTALDLDARAASVYDPYHRATAIGVPGKALDGDGSTSWYADTPPGAQQVGLGFVVSLGQSRGIRSVDITTPTPGFRVEVYATDEATPPPTILDTRWAHITDKGDVGNDGKTHIVLGAGTSKYQTLLLWITKPPSEGARVRISELKVFG